jgi:hypothetical protein
MNRTLHRWLAGGIGGLALLWATRAGVVQAQGHEYYGPTPYAQPMPTWVPGKVTHEPAEPRGQSRILRSIRGLFKKTPEGPTLSQYPSHHVGMPMDSYPSLAPMQSPHAAGISSTSATPKGRGATEVQVVQGRSRTVQARRKIVRHHVANPEIAQLAQLAAGDVKEMAVMGLQQGTTTVTLWIQGDSRPVSLLVRVIPESAGTASHAYGVTQVMGPNGKYSARPAPALAIETSRPVTVAASVRHNRAGVAPVNEHAYPMMAQVGMPVDQHIIVKNVGATDAEQIEVRAALSLDSALVSTEPKATVVDDSTLAWQIPHIAAGSHQRLTVRVRPLQPGELSCKTSFRVRSGEPSGGASSIVSPESAGTLKLICEGDAEAVTGSPVHVKLKVINNGSTAMHAVRIRQMLGDVVRAAGDAPSTPPELMVGSLEPGETRVYETGALAREAGLHSIRLLAEAENGQQTSVEHLIRVHGPQLALSTTGPEFRYANRKATYQLVLSNPGDRPATNVHLMVGLPPGLEYAEAAGGASYSPENRTVAWAVGLLEPGQTCEYNLTVLPKTEGEHLQRAVAWADNELIVKSDKITRVEGTKSVAIEIEDADDPVEIGYDTHYRVRVVNRGTKSVEGAQLVVHVPGGMEITGAEGPGAYRIEGKKVVFESIPPLASQSATTVKVLVRGTTAGEQRLRAELAAPSLSSPVVAEELTQVYAGN